MSLAAEKFLRELEVKGIKTIPKISAFRSIFWLFKEILRRFVGSVSYNKKTNLVFGGLPTPKPVDSPEPASISKIFLERGCYGRARWEERGRVQNAWLFALNKVLADKGLSVDRSKTKHNFMLPLCINGSSINDEIAEGLISQGFPILSWPDLLSKTAGHNTTPVYYLPVNPSINVERIFRLLDEVPVEADGQITNTMIPCGSPNLPVVQTHSYTLHRASGREKICADVTEWASTRQRIKKFGIFELRLASFGPVFKIGLSFWKAIEYLKSLGRKGRVGNAFVIPLISPYLINCAETEYLLFRAGYSRIAKFRPWQSAKLNLRGQGLASLRANLNKKWRNQLVRAESREKNIVVSREKEDLRLIYKKALIIWNL